LRDIRAHLYVFEDIKYEILSESMMRQAVKLVTEHAGIEISGFYRVQKGAEEAIEEVRKAESLSPRSASKSMIPKRLIIIDKDQ